jgi:hypothetical protein
MDQDRRALATAKAMRKNAELTVAEVRPHREIETKPRKTPGRRGDPLSAYPVTRERPVRVIFQNKPEDVQKIVASKPEKEK